jgi:cation-transporting ATPase E
MLWRLRTWRRASRRGAARTDRCARRPGGQPRAAASAPTSPQRVAAGQTNVTPRPGGRTTWDIIRGNTLTFFNLILGVLFVVMMVFGNWRDALFGWVIVINSGIGIYQEMRTKLVLDVSICSRLRRRR